MTDELPKEILDFEAMYAVRFKEGESPVDKLVKLLERMKALDDYPMMGLPSSGNKGAFRAFRANTEGMLAREHLDEALEVVRDVKIQIDVERLKAYGRAWFEDPRPPGPDASPHAKFVWMQVAQGLAEARTGMPYVEHIEIDGRIETRPVTPSEVERMIRGLVKQRDGLERILVQIRHLVFTPMLVLWGDSDLLGDDAPTDFANKLARRLGAPMDALRKIFVRGGS